jgi:predicted dithiol-disulfide oxidoreductase (DUF899 family)
VSTTTELPTPRIVSREEWLAARRQLLAEEKEFTRRYDAHTAKQRALPWVRIEKDFVFDSPSGKVTLAQLFQDRSQLFIKYFMMGPGAKHQCVGCSLEVDHVAEEVASGGALYNFHPAPAWTSQIEDMSGHSIFYRDTEGRIFHTYSTYGRGEEQFMGIYRFLDLTPRGRNEDSHGLVDWARPRNMYGKGGVVEANGRYHAPACGCAAHQASERS